MNIQFVRIPVQTNIQEKNQKTTYIAPTRPTINKDLNTISGAEKNKS